MKLSLTRVIKHGEMVWNVVLLYIDLRLSTPESEERDTGMWVSTSISIIIVFSTKCGQQWSQWSTKNKINTFLFTIDRMKPRK